MFASQTSIGFTLLHLKADLFIVQTQMQKKTRLRAGQVLLQGVAFLLIIGSRFLGIQRIYNLIRFFSLSFLESRCRGCTTRPFLYSPKKRKLVRLFFSKSLVFRKG